MKGCTECYKTSDNQHFNCPYRMADGRHFTDYRPRCLTNYAFPTDRPMSSYEYRQYLVHNATELMQQNKRAFYKTNSCGPCVEPFNVGTMLPEQNMVECDASTCKISMNDQNGLGNGRKYSSSVDQAQQAFLKMKQKEQEILSQQKNCCTTSEDDLSLYPFDNSFGSSYARLTVPGGGEPFNGGNVL